MWLVIAFGCAVTSAAILGALLGEVLATRYRGGRHTEVKRSLG